MDRKRVFVIGLDGGTFTIVKPMVQKGMLPHLAKMMQKGSWGNLMSTIPHNTACAWPSFMTGKNPGKHGVFHFFNSKTDSYEGYLVNAKSIRAKTLWQILSAHGKKVGVVDVPMTFPPEPVNGFLISGMPLPSSATIFTHPPHLYTELIRECGDFPHEDTVIKLFHEGRGSEFLKQLYMFTENRLQATLYLMRRYEWDLFMVVFRGTDFVGHYGARFWSNDYCQRHPEEASKYSELITQYYEAIDRAIGKILEHLDDDCRVIVMSDHGIGPLKKHFYVNKWLTTVGLLKLKKFHKFRTYYLTIPRYSLHQIFEKIHLGFLANFLPRCLSGKIIPIPRIRMNSHPSKYIDWKKTKAYSPWTSGEGIIRLNVKGRSSQGIVENGEEYEKIRDYIIGRLYAIRDSETNDRVIEKVFKREEIYSGPFVEEAPDILFLMDETGYFSRSELESKEILVCRDNDFFGPHHLDGMLIMQGKDLTENMALKDVRIIDLAATILYLFGLPVPDDMDGRVLSEAIESSYKTSIPIRYRNIANGEEISLGVDAIYSPDEKKHIEEHLRALGYMS